MKMKSLKKYASLGMAALVLACANLASAQAQILITNVINNFATGTQGSQPTGCGFWYGSGTAGWDGTEFTAGSSGSLYIQTIFSTNSDTPCTEYVCLPGDNLWWSGNGTFTPSSYQTLQFDIKWDTNSVLTIPQFNNPSTVPANLLQSWAPYGYLSGSIQGLEVDFAYQGNGSTTFLIDTNIPTAASNGWVHISIPINPALPNIDPSVGIMFKKWLNQNWGMMDGSTATANFWVDNVILVGTAAPPPPPKLSPPVKAVQGLNVFSSTEGNSFYDRQEAELMQNTGLSWVGQATPANPVTYSFDIVGYPNSYNCEAYLFLSPNPAGNDGAPDWNETNCAVFYLQGNTSSAKAYFQYKVNEPGGNTMYGGGAPYTNAPGSWDGVTTPWLESGSLAAFTTSSGIYGTWTLQFTSDTNGTIIAPNGSSTNFVIPPYNVGRFMEQTTPGFNVYLGMQANAADGMNQAVVYGNFAVSNTASPYNENFLADTSLDTVNTWRTSVASGPKGVLIVPAGSASWVDWTLPANGFNLQAAPVLNSPLAWTTPSIGPIIPLYGLDAQLVASSEIPAGPAAFFQLIKRVGTQLQVLLPGESNAPNTPSGKTGTPTSFNPYDEVDVTINMVDATYHIVNSADTLSLTTTDSTATVNTPAPVLSGGTVTVPIYFGTAGSWTVTAADTTSPTITSGTSSSVTIQ